MRPKTVSGKVNCTKLGNLANMSDTKKYQYASKSFPNSLKGGSKNSHVIRLYLLLKRN